MGFNARQITYDYTASPIGAMLPFGGETAPSGWLSCNGAAVSRTVYSELFAAIGTLWGIGDGSTTFNLPDSRGIFFRGWDNGAGIDPDKAGRTAIKTGGATGDHVGSKQTDETKSHTHTFTSTNSGAFANSTGIVGNANGGGGATPLSSINGNTGGNETRPTNAYVHYIIKATNTITASSTTSPKHVIQGNATSLTTRTKLNFVGATVTDNAGNDSTDVSVSELSKVDSIRRLFSVDCIEDSEEQGWGNQYTQQLINFGSKFESVTSGTEALHQIITIPVPSDSSEVTLTGSWSNNDNATNYFFGRSKSTSTVGDTAKFSFFGNCVYGVFYYDTSGDTYRAELSDDGGTTWKYQRICTIDADSGGAGLHMPFFEGLELKQWTIRLTVLATTGGSELDLFYYTTKLCLVPTGHYYYQATAVKTINDIPPTHTLMTGTFDRVNAWGNTSYMSSNYSRSGTVNDTFEVKFVGKYLWVVASWETGANVTVAVTIDGVTTNVRATTINCYTPNNNQWSLIRLDNGNLSDGVHTAKLTVQTVTSGQFYLCGWGWYSALNNSTVCHALGLGRDSEIIPIVTGDSRWSFSGASWAAVADDSRMYLRKYKYCTTNGDYAYITIPNYSDIQAIYLISSQYSDRGIVEATLGGQNSRFFSGLTYDTNSNRCYVQLLYDANVDGITLHNKELRLYKRSGTGFYPNAIIIERWGSNKISTSEINVFQKWTRYNLTNASTRACTPVAYSFYTKGINKTGTDAVNVMHTGNINCAGNANAYMDLGFGYNNIATINTIRASLTYNSGGAIFPNENDPAFGYIASQSTSGSTATRPSIIRKYAGSYSGDTWWKVYYQVRNEI